MTKKEKEICRKYSARDENGKVHCNECPLVIDHRNCICKAAVDLLEERVLYGREKRS